MDGKGRALDNVFIERFWQLLKYETGEEVYMWHSTTIKGYIGLYNFLHKEEQFWCSSLFL